MSTLDVLNRFEYMLQEAERRAADGEAECHRLQRELDAANARTDDFLAHVNELLNHVMCGWTATPPEGEEPKELLPTDSLLAVLMSRFGAKCMLDVELELTETLGFVGNTPTPIVEGIDTLIERLGEAKDEAEAAHWDAVEREERASLDS